MKVITTNLLNRLWKNGVLEKLKLKVDVAKIVNNFTTTVEGTVADGRAVKTLKDELDSLNGKLSIASLFGIENAYANGMCDNALYINLNDPHGQENKTCIVDGGFTKNIPSDLAWGVREVLYLSSNAIIVRITGIKTDGVTNVIFTNIYNYGKWTGWHER